MWVCDVVMGLVDRIEGVGSVCGGVVSRWRRVSSGGEVERRGEGEGGVGL